VKRLSTFRNLKQNALQGGMGKVKHASNLSLKNESKCCKRQAFRVPKYEMLKKTA
jgi:hypothetical protein